MADSGSPFSRVHFFPKRGNKIIIAGREEIIPPGIGVISGGVIGEVGNCSIDKVLGQALAPNTLYWVYVYMRNRVMTLDFSGGRHVEDPCSGVQIHYADPLRSLVGMVRTNELGTIHGNGVQQCTLSWFNKEQASLMASLDNLFTEPSEGDTAMYVPAGAVKLEFLTWCINGAFTEAFPNPDVIVEGTVQNTVVGKYVHVGVEVDGVAAHHYIGGHFQGHLGDCGFAQSKSIGCNAASEGHHYARPMIGHGGTSGRALFASAIITVPLLYS